MKRKLLSSVVTPAAQHTSICQDVNKYNKTRHVIVRNIYRVYTTYIWRQSWYIRLDELRVPVP